MRRLGGSAGGRSSGYSFVQMVRNAEGQWEDCREDYIAACRAARAALRFREAFEDGGVGGERGNDRDRCRKQQRRLV